MTKLGSVIGQKIDYNGVWVLKDQRHIPSKNRTKELPKATTVARMHAHMYRHMRLQLTLLYFLALLHKFTFFIGTRPA